MTRPAIITIALVELRRFLRQRENLFFAFILPILLVFVIGLQFGSGSDSARVLIVGEQSALRSDLREAIETNDLTADITDEETALEELARGRAEVAVVIGAEAAQSYADPATPLDIELIRAGSAEVVLAEHTVRTAVTGLDTQRQQHQALITSGVPAADAASALSNAEGQVPPIQVSVDDRAPGADPFAQVSGFDLGASSQLLLFVFLTSLTGATTFIDARRQRVITRALAAPIRARDVLIGQVLGRWVIAMGQGVTLMIGSTVIFDVDWGNLVAGVVVLAVFALVAAGAGITFGAVLDHEGAATGAGIGAGLVLAALGGCMVPLDLFSGPLHTIAHITPHAWAYEAFASIQRHGGTIASVLPQVGMLAVFAVIVLGAGTIAVRRSISRAS